GATALRRWVELGKARPADDWLKANQANIRNWHTWRKSFYNDDSTPLRVEPVFKEINRIAEQDAVYVADVGNVTLNAIRHLEMNGEQQFTTSGWFATMGNGVPGGIAAQLSYPNKQVFT
ncbi:pyruvate oxidase, partial [Vitellibacter sp. q18]|nr:pyruvate oxidase [Aequorivita lutea]